MSETSVQDGQSEVRRTELAFGLLASAALLLPVGDTLSKLLTSVVHPAEVAFWRLTFQAAALLLMTQLLRRRARGNILVPLLAAGGVMHAATLVCLIGAFAVMPIATAISIFFVEPLILTVLSALILGEKTGWRRYLAVTVGLLGAVVVIRPNWSTFGAHALLPLGAAAAFAMNMILIRLASRSHSGLAIQAGISLYAAAGLGTVLVVSGGLGWTGWSGLSAPTFVWGVYLAMGCLAAVTFLMIAEAFRRARASILAPVQYLEIVGATLLGYLVFGDFPDLLTWVGTAIILTSGLYVFRRERLREKRQDGR